MLPNGSLDSADGRFPKPRATPRKRRPGTAPAAVVRVSCAVEPALARANSSPYRGLQNRRPRTRKRPIRCREDGKGRLLLRQLSYLACLFYQAWILLQPPVIIS